MEKTNIVKAIVYLLGAIGAALAIAFGCTSCNVTRIVTTTAQSVKTGDTTTTIMTKTVESYDAKKNVNL